MFLQLANLGLRLTEINKSFKPKNSQKVTELRSLGFKQVYTGSSLEPPMLGFLTHLRGRKGPSISHIETCGYKERKKYSAETRIGFEIERNLFEGVHLMKLNSTSTVQQLNLG